LDTAHHPLLERNQSSADASIHFGVRGGKVFCDARKIGARLTERGIGFQPADSVKAQASAALEEAFARSRDRPDANLCFEAAPDTSRIMPLQ